MTRVGSGSSSSCTIGTIEYNYTHVSVRPPAYFPRHGPVHISTSAIGVFQSFLGQLMKAPTDGFDRTIYGLRIVLRGWIRTVTEGIFGGDHNPEFGFLHPDWTFVNSSYFGLGDIRVIHRFLETVKRAPTGGFSSSVLGLRFQNLEHVFWIREQATTYLPGFQVS